MELEIRRKRVIIGIIMICMICIIIVYISTPYILYQRTIYTPIAPTQPQPPPEFIISASHSEIVVHNISLSTISKYTPVPPSPSFQRLLQLQNKQIACTTISGIIYIFNLSNTGTLTLSYTLNIHTKGDIWGIVQLSNGDLVTGGNDLIIRIWDLGGKRERGRLLGHTNYVISLLQHSSGLLLSGGEDQTVRAWNLTTGECIYTYNDYRGYIWGLVPVSEKYIISLIEDKEEGVRVWELRTGRTLGEVKGLGATAGILLDDKLLIGGFREFRVYNYHLFGTTDHIFQYSWGGVLSHNVIRQILSLQADLVAIASWDGFIKIINIRDRKILKVVHSRNKEEINSLIGCYH